MHPRRYFNNSASLLLSFHPRRERRFYRWIFHASIRVQLIIFYSMQLRVNVTRSKYTGSTWQFCVTTIDEKANIAKQVLARSIDRDSVYLERDVKG